ncbi:MAG: HEAT repeat domain-containing protein [Leptolyngbyaceae cyanobacterium]
MTQDELFAQLKHPNPHLRERAMWELAEHQDQTTISRLISNLDEEDVVYRRASVKALGTIGVASVPPLVDIALNSDNVTARASALKALTQVVVRHPETPFPQLGMDALQTALSDANPVVYIASVMTLGEMKSSAAFDILADALKSTDNIALAVAIVNAMPAIGSEQAKVLLEECVQETATEVYVKEMAQSALSRIDLLVSNQAPH